MEIWPNEVCDRHKDTIVYNVDYSLQEPHLIL